MLVSTHPESPASAGQRVLRLQCQNQTRIHSPASLHPSISGGQIYGKLPTKKKWDLNWNVIDWRELEVPRSQCMYLICGLQK